MRQFVVTRARDRGLKRVEAFDEGEHLEAAVAAELAEIEGLEAEVFIGADPIDVARTAPSSRTR